MSSPLPGIDLPSLWEALTQKIRPTMFLRSERIDQLAGARVLLVSETMQETGSFKFRAATAVTLQEPAPRLLTASSGNFGAALAVAARRSMKGCTVVMPSTSAQVKLAAVENHFARVERVDTTKMTRAARLAELLAQDPEARAVSPYDDARVIAGNASLGVELFRAHRPDCVVAPVGGGGLSSGLVVARDLFATCDVIGAEPRLANDAARSLKAGKRIAHETEPQTICDGARTLSLGVMNFEILQRGLADIEEVEEKTVARAVRLLFETLTLKAEPTGALALAALLQNPARFSGKQVACIVSGGNVDDAVHAACLRQ